MVRGLSAGPLCIYGNILYTIQFVAYFDATKFGVFSLQ